MKQKRNNPTQEYQRPAQEFEQKILDMSRVSRVTSGGRRFSFRAVVVIGDRAGRVGVGVKKGKDVQYAIDKAVKSAKNNLVKAQIAKGGTILHESYGKFGSSIVFLKPNMEGRGIIAGGAVRAICDLAGYSNISGKILSRSGNKLNIARATIVALTKIKSAKVKVKNDKEKLEKAENPKKKVRKKKETKKN
jgi:small subunit ribosomal protein S5